MEILVVGALVGILVLAAVPQFFTPDALDVELHARQVAADLVMARRLAIAGHESYLVTFTPAGGPYSAYSLGPQSGGVDPDFPKAFSAGLSVTGLDQIVFTPTGSAAPAGTLTINFSLGTATADVQIIAATGRVQVIGP